jgi:putative ABC transport system permease protein
MFGKKKFERELNDELHAYIELQAAEKARRGMSPDDALREARIELGGIEQVKENVRDVRPGEFINRLFQDIQYAFRTLRRNPAFAFVAILTLALGIGMNSAIFSVVDAVMLRPLPYPEPQRLLALWECNRQTPQIHNSVSPANLADYRQQQLLEGLSAWSFGGTNLGGDGQPERLVTNNVSYNYFAVLGVHPAIGRGFLPEEDRPGTNHVVIISHDLWARRFGLDPAIIGTKVMLDDVPHQVVGVMPDGFAPPYQFGFPQKIEAFVPFGFTPDLLSDAGRSDHEVQVIARMRPGVTLTQAQSGLDAISEQLAKTFPDSNGHIRVGLSLLGDDLVRSYRPALQVLLGAVGLILLIACVNVANLLLVRGGSRRREIAVRRALGARRSRICSELLVQSAILAGIGCICGLLVGIGTRQVLVNLAPPGIPRIDRAALDWHVLAFTMIVSCSSTILFGLLPALQASNVAAGDALKSGQGTASFCVMRWRNSLLVAEVAIALVLTTGAGLLLESFVRLIRVNLSFQTDRILTMVVPLPRMRYPNAAARANFFDRLEERVSHLPGVQGVFSTSQIPMRGEWGTGVETEDNRWPESSAGAKMAVVSSKAVTPGFFQALEIPLLAGRLLTRGDQDGALSVIVINERMAKDLWPGRDPLGRRLRRGSKAPWLTVVGVVRDARLGGPEEDLKPHMFIPAAQVGSYPVTLANFGVRTSDDPWRLLKTIQSEVRALDREQPIFQPMTLKQYASKHVADRRFMASLLLVFAGVALSLALVGVYGVVAYSVSQRVPEIGVRVALGATPINIVALFLRRASALTALGVVLGLVGAMALSKYLTSLLFHVKPTDPATFAMVAVLVGAAALAACYLPARRASRVDPMVALRYE